MKWKMLANRQSSGTIPEEIDWLKIDVSTGAISELASFNTRGGISSGSVGTVTETGTETAVLGALIAGSVLAGQPT